MQRLAELLPEFAKQIENGLRAIDKPELADQVAHATVDRWSHSPGDDAGFIYLHPPQELNIVERNIIGSRYSHSVELEDLAGMVVVDVDNLGRVTGIELLNRTDTFDELAKKLPAKRAPE